MKKGNIAFALMIVILSTIMVPTTYAQDEVPYGPWVDQITFQAESEQAKVLDMLENNEVQLHVSDINDPDVFASIRASANIDSSISYGLFFDLTFNPVGPTFPGTGKFNPFSNPKIREAMNWLIDRRFIADELMYGLAVPKTVPHVGAMPEYGRLADVFREVEAEYDTPDYDRAKAQIFEQMTLMGAEFIEGGWYWEDEQITLEMLIRIDSPPRTRIGDYVSNLLEGLGFLTERSYRDSGEASPIWLFGDPADGVWHVYTGGWITELVVRDNSGTYAFHYTPRGMWGTSLGQAYDPDPLFAEVAYRLDDADYDTWEERQALMAQATWMCLEDSVKVWLVDQIVPYPYRKEIQVAADMASGLFGSAISTRTIKIQDQVGGTVKASDRDVLVDPWNPVVGTNWAYDMHVLVGTVDDSVIANPYTGLYMPNTLVSAELDVLEGALVFNSSPDWLTLNFVDEIEVPADAWYGYDTATNQVINPPEGTTARAKAVLNYGDVIGNVMYHDGSVMSQADWIATWALDWERNDPASPFYDESYGPDFSNFRSEFQGMKIVSWNPVIVEVYLDYYAPDAEYIVNEADKLSNFQQPTEELAGFWPSVPWQVKAIGMLAEEKGLLAWTADKSEELEAEWMNYIGGPSLPILENMLTEAKNTGYVPFEEITSDYLEAGEVSQRYSNLEAWYQEMGHFWVGDGPFYLDTVDFTGHTASIAANRDYRFKADKWAFLAAPPIPESSVAAPENVVPGLEATFVLSLSAAGQPYANDRIDFVKYLFVDSVGNLITKGDATATAEGQWSVPLTVEETAGMTAGTYTLTTIAMSKDVAIPGSLDTPFIVIPELTYFQTLLAQTEAELDTSISQLEDTLSDQITQLQGAVSSSTTTMYIAIGVAAIALIIALYAAFARK
jgi:peptide/nickel transport system substrate-binding protein